MTLAEKVEFWKAMVPVIGLAATSLIVTCIHALSSARGRQENRQQNNRIENKVSEIKGQVETLPQIIKKENGKDG